MKASMQFNIGSDETMKTSMHFNINNEIKKASIQFNTGIDEIMFESMRFNIIIDVITKAKMSTSIGCYEVMKQMSSSV
ncbi:hypothetical protein CHS0354_011916 [Potamilus streckersoni]|uniref:Uncharacterized protein n=1 Tax=Potamilus streckersoni TaxID=2493646 RepID=A0AAE0T0D8_9BIVA|nr:hypothetical protein CHS0354_011916 [Potamilus streckersoni]